MVHRKESYCETERIKCAAIKLANGKLFEGRDHSKAYKAAKEAGTERLDSLRAKQGFVTESGKFVDRNEAAKIAYAARQIQREITSNAGLFSEDLNYPILVCPKCSETTICNKCDTPFTKKPVCETCGGSKRIICLRCRDLQTSVERQHFPCPRCKATGFIPCPACPQPPVGDVISMIQSVSAGHTISLQEAKQMLDACQQPPASEFVERGRTAVKAYFDSPSFDSHKQSPKFQDLLSFADEACSRLDAQQQGIEELEAGKLDDKVAIAGLELFQEGLQSQLAKRGEAIRWTKEHCKVLCNSLIYKRIIENFKRVLGDQFEEIIKDG